MNLDKELYEWIQVMSERKASDLILTQGQPAIIRVSGDLQAVGEKILQSEDVKRMARSILTPGDFQKFETELEADASFGIPEIGRFRVNVFHQQAAAGIDRKSTRLNSSH